MPVSSPRRRRRGEATWSRAYSGFSALSQMFSIKTSSEAGPDAAEAMNLKQRQGHPSWRPASSPSPMGVGGGGGERVPKQAHAHLGALSNCPHIIKLFLRKNQTSSSQIFSRAVRSPSRACWQANPCNCLSSPLSSCFEDGLLLPTNRRRLAIIPSQSSSSIRRRKTVSQHKRPCISLESLRGHRPLSLSLSGGHFSQQSRINLSRLS